MDVCAMKNDTICIAVFIPSLNFSFGFASIAVRLVGCKRPTILHGSFLPIPSQTTMIVAPVWKRCNLLLQPTSLQLLIIYA